MRKKVLKAKGKKMNIDFPSCSTIATAFNKDQNIINEASQASSNNLTPHDVQVNRHNEYV